MIIIANITIFAIVAIIAIFFKKYRNFSNSCIFFRFGIKFHNFPSKEYVSIVRISNVFFPRNLAIHNGSRAFHCGSIVSRWRSLRPPRSLILFASAFLWVRYCAILCNDISDFPNCNIWIPGCILGEGKGCWAGRPLKALIFTPPPANHVSPN